MKIRTDFVSNSSSTSFVLLGKTMNFKDFIKLVEAAGWKRQDDEDDDYYTDGTSDDLWDIKDWLTEKTKGFIDIEGAGDDYGISDIVVGADPSKMKDDNTLKDFKLKIIDALKKVGIIAKPSEIKFESGGSDASGMSWIGDCG